MDILAPALDVSRLVSENHCTNPKFILRYFHYADAGAGDKSVDTLAFETLIPKSIVQRYVSLLVEHRRIILCGPSGTGKTFLAHRLAEYLVLRLVTSQQIQFSSCALMF